MDIINSSGSDTGVRGGTTSPPVQHGSGVIILGPRSTSQDVPAAWSHLAAGATLRITPPASGSFPVEFQLPDGRTLVQLVDARTARIELIRDAHGRYQTVLTAAAPPVPAPPKAAAGGRG